ncbi:MAG TPA: hypothetical protein VMT15_12990 [Bryobacteraceae bacterium]|nr:hypothetical protein [Bryobacteraceae bacterium]
MTIIADTSPLHYAVLIGIPEAIFALYGRIVIPGAVHVELTGAGSPQDLREWLEHNLQRIEVRQVTVPDDPHLQALDAGEAQAIELAQQTPDSLLLIDEKDGRAEARRRGIRITGLLGVIRDAARSGYLDFESTLEQLKRTDFRLSAEVEAIVRVQYRTAM